MSPDLSRLASLLSSAPPVAWVSRPEREPVAFPVAFLSSSQPDDDATDTPPVYTGGVASVVATGTDPSKPRRCPSCQHEHPVLTTCMECPTCRAEVRHPGPNLVAFPLAYPDLPW